MDSTNPSAPPPEEPTPLRPAEPPPPPPAAQYAPPPTAQFAPRRQSQFAASPAASKPGRGCFFYFLLVFFIATVSLGLLLMALPIFALLALGPDTANQFTSGLAKASSQMDIREVYVPGAADEFCPRKIAVINIHGVILPEGGRGFAQSQRLVDELEWAANDEDVVAVILDMDTPGGSVTASDEIYQAVRYCAETKPVVTCMRSLGASGGYYVAAGSDWIIANRHTLTGSIGVIISAFNYAELMERWGLKVETLKSGAMKDMLSGSRPTNEVERQYMQTIVQETFHEFAAIVAEGRPAFENVEAVLAADFADGRILRGPAALEAGLVDQLGYFDDAVDKAVELADGEPAKLIRYRRRPTVSDFLFSASAERDLAQTVLPASLRALKTGGLYAIWPHALAGAAE